MIGWSFLGLVIVTFVGLLGLREPRARTWWLLAASVAMFALAEPWALVPVLALAAGVYALTWRGRALWAVVWAVALLLVYKIAAAAQGGAPLRTIAEPLVPLGLSYLTFSAIHYAVEARRGMIERRGFVDFLHFLLFFPTVTAGPIKRYPGFAPLPTGSLENLYAAIPRVAGGLIKVLVLAPPCRMLVQTVVEMPVVGMVDAWLVLYAGAFWLYLDFSGYSDIAIAVSRALGYRVPENFNWPYLKPNVREFWRNWHMSLTSWVTDYVYIPLGGNRVGFGRQLLNVGAVMMVIALWHGLAPRFIVFGLYQATGMIVFTVWRRWRAVPRDYRGTLVGRVVGGLLTFHFLSFSWLFIFADVPQVMEIGLALIGWGVK